MQLSGDYNDPRVLVRHPEGVSCMLSESDEVSIFLHKLNVVKVYASLPLADAKKLCNDLYMSIMKAESCSLPSG